MKEIEILLEGKPYAPLPQQFAFHECQLKFKAYLGAVGAGKTVCGAAETVATALAYPGSEILVGTISWRHLRTVTWKSLRDMMPEELIADERKSSDDLGLTLKNGTLIHGWSLDSATSFMGLTLGGFWIDECTLIEDEVVYQNLMTRLRQGKGPRRGWLTGNPMGRDWVWKAFAHEKREDHALFIGKTNENTHLEPDYYASLIRNLSPSQRKRLLNAEFGAWEGLIFWDFSEEAHVIEPFEIPDHWPRYRAIDPGLRDPAACLWAALDEDGNTFVYQEYYETGKIISEQAAAILAKTGNEGISYTVIDPTAGSDRLAQGKSQIDLYREAGIESLIPGSNSDLDADISLIHEQLHVDARRRHPLTGKKGSPRLFVFRNCGNLRHELTQWRRDDRGKIVFRDDHLIACVRYLFQSRPSKAVAIDKREKNPQWAAFWKGISDEATAEPNLRDVVGNEKVRW